MSSLPDRPRPINEIAIEKKYPKRDSDVVNIERTSDTWLKILIACLVLFVGIMSFIVVDVKASYQYRIAVNGNHYQCNVIERGNPTYLKDCWQGDEIIIYDSTNLVVIE